MDSTVNWFLKDMPCSSIFYLIKPTQLWSLFMPFIWYLFMQSLCWHMWHHMCFCKTLDITMQTSPADSLPSSQCPGQNKAWAWLPAIHSPHGSAVAAMVQMLPCLSNSDQESWGQENCKPQWSNCWERNIGEPSNRSTTATYIFTAKSHQWGLGFPRGFPRFPESNWARLPNIANHLYNLYIIYIIRST